MEQFFLVFKYKEFKISLNVFRQEKHCPCFKLNLASVELKLVTLLLHLSAPTVDYFYAIQHFINNNHSFRRTNYTFATVIWNI
jgi:hypothetical protein